MTSRLDKLRRFIRTARAGGPQGDLAILKADALGAGPPEGVTERLAPVRGYLPRYALEDLRPLPDGTLGRELARMLDANGLRPFEISPELRAELDDHTWMARYIATHDMLHLVTGFDTSLAGEMGVLAVTVAQGFAPGGAMQEWSARLLYPLAAPSQARAVAQNRRVGHEIGRRARFLLAFRYEDHFDAPLDDLRQQLAIPDPQEIGVVRVHGAAA